MTSETALITALRGLADTPGARGLMDDAAVLEIGGKKLVLTLDTVVESVHFLPNDPPQDVAWKLVAVNVSDLAAKSATPLGCLYSHALGDDAWDRAFLDGLGEACAHFAMPLLGGDTVRMPQDAPRSFSLTALGKGPTGATPVPSRLGAKPGDRVWVSGTIGDAGLGLAVLTGQQRASGEARDALIAAYRRPAPDVALGLALAPLVHAMMDVSDGVLVDAGRMASASGCALAIAADTVPLSPHLCEVLGDTLDTRLAAMTAGDDFRLLFTAPPECTAHIHEIAASLGCPVSAIGGVSAGAGLTLVHKGEPLPLPERLGYEH